VNSHDSDARRTRAGHDLSRTYREEIGPDGLFAQLPGVQSVGEQRVEDCILVRD
jgi:hypothetical protein